MLSASDPSEWGTLRPARPKEMEKEKEKENGGTSSSELGDASARTRNSGGIGGLNPNAQEWTPTLNFADINLNQLSDDLFARRPPRPHPRQSTTSLLDGLASLSISNKTTAANSAHSSPLPHHLAVSIPLLKSFSPSCSRPLKPGLGSLGNPIHVLTNFYAVDIPHDLVVFMYDVRIVPETVTKVNRRVMDAFRDLLNRMDLHGWEWRAVYDGAKNLYSPNRLPFTNDEIQYPVDLIDDDIGRRRIQKFIVRIRKTSEIQMDKLNLYNSGKLIDSGESVPKDAIHVLEVLLRQRPGAIFTTIGRGGGSFYSEVHNTPIANALTVHQGWYQSIKPTFSQIKLNLDVSATSFYVSGPLLDTVAKYFNKPHIELTRAHLSDPHERKRLERFLRDVTIEISYRHTGRKRYKIKGLFDKPCAQTLIVTGTGEGRIKQIVPIAAYFQEMYGIVLQFPWLPCVVCGSKSDVVLPMEVCFVRRNQRHIGKLNDQQLADIVKLTAVLPEYRKERVADGMRQLHGTGTPGGDPVLASWGVQIQPNMSIIEGRILQPPPLIFGPSNNPATNWQQVITPTDGTWRIGRNLRFAQPAILNTWAVAVFGDPHHFPLHTVSIFIKHILNACVGLGMEVSERNLGDVVVYAPVPPGGGRMGSDTIEATLRLANERALRVSGVGGGGFVARTGGYGGDMWEFDELLGGGGGTPSVSSSFSANGFSGSFPAGTSNPGFGGMIGYAGPPVPGGLAGSVGVGSGGTGGVAQLVICILAQKNTVYEQVKKIAETDIGLMTQCVIGKHVHTTKPSYSQNLALKINAKLGGVNSYVDPVNELGGLGMSNVPTIIMGADVTHPQYSSSDPSSIAAVVGTVDQRYCEYRSSVRIQNTRREIIADLEGMTRDLFEQFRIRNGCYPMRILFYRDGVSEAQLSDVLSEEVSAVRRACVSLGIGDAKLTFTVVNKRHHARFFPVRMEAGESDMKGNILAGTVIDSGVTHPFEFDFYLTSHPGMQGTSKAAHYHVLYDNNEFGADTLQEITYRLCYNFARSTRAVSIVPPAYYAHLVAARARCYASAQSSPHGWHHNNFASSSPAMEPFVIPGWGNVGGQPGSLARSYSNSSFPGASSPSLDHMFPMVPPSPALSNSGMYGGPHVGKYGTSVSSASSYMTNFGSSRHNSNRVRELPQVSPQLQGTMFFT
ncbi:Piwi-domain-containing protein [Rhizoclosmatium globosum]|uniref:Piwi-domain-containing protein n=1 Tax=Rhizoclosmatium globosum TaxID=329046 RepID=A0A1Y2C4H2_9FUNG|nr:Piwi-domain-containing protein [Rhizoclosmatium globosum]|eukprot:ORY41928.1 Piwi-domain-containing protein [Rhizoclosmatium globosum]